MSTKKKNCNRLTIKRKQQGIAEQFTVIADSYGYNTDSSEYNIDNLVIIRFIYGDKRIISAKKCKDVHSIVNINVGCTKKGIIYKQWFCIDGPSEICLDNIVSDSDPIASTYTIELNVVVSKMITMGATLYEDENFTDFRLSTVDGSVGVHKASLAAHSDMFKTMLNGEWKETVEGRIEVPGASLQTLQALKDFMYLGKVPEEGLKTLLQIAIRFFIESLKRQCIIKLALNAKPEEYLELLDFARDKEIVELTFALVQLTPKEVINSGYQLMIKSKQLPEAGDETDTE